MGRRGYEKLAVLLARKTPLVVADPLHVDLERPVIRPEVRPRMF
jgi:hypothetical protein